MSKGPDAFRTISEVAEELDLPQHVLRFWETRFSQIRPMKRGGGRRYYRPDDVDLLRGIRKLLYGEGYTIKGVQRILKEQGARQVIVAGQGGELDPAPPDHRFEPEFDNEVPDGILVDENHTVRPSASGGRTGHDQRREPQFGGRREPVLTDRAAPFGRAEAHVAPERSAEPDFAAVPQSRIPAAPPEEPDEAEVYLPPQAVQPAPPPPYHSPAQVRTQPFEGPAIRGFAPPTEEDDRTPSARATNLAHLSDDDMDRLQAALVELLECKRILDQAR
ncbi:MAG TPA: MerR family transcriptional regulator [Kaistia sp.]|nr:MerR family transcriptional regulator [Kaistia sp.]